MNRQRISSGSTFERDYAYSRAVVLEDGYVFVAGTTGYDYATMTISDDLGAQCDQTLRNIAAALQSAGCSMADIVRVHYLLTPGQDFAACAPVLRRWMGDARPAATMLVVGLLDPAMKIEIEVTAKCPVSPGPSISAGT